MTFDCNLYERFVNFIIHYQHDFGMKAEAQSKAQTKWSELKHNKDAVEQSIKDVET